MAGILILGPRIGFSDINGRARGQNHGIVAQVKREICRAIGQMDRTAQIISRWKRHRAPARLARRSNCSIYGRAVQCRAIAGGAVSLDVEIGGRLCGAKI